jgi:superfamily II DNA/RNA helicase
VSAALQEIADGLGVRLLTLCGGVAQEWQERELALGPQLLVATPGRLRDLLAQRRLGLSNLRTLVLDEADRLLEMGFWPDIQWLMKAMPEARQQMLFSATLPVELESLASGGDQYQSLYPVTGCVQPLQQRQAECQGLATAGPGQGKQIPS